MATALAPIPTFWKFVLVVPAPSMVWECAKEGGKRKAKAIGTRRIFARRVPRGAKRKGREWGLRFKFISIRIKVARGKPREWRKGLIIGYFKDKRLKPEANDNLKRA